MHLIPGVEIPCRSVPESCDFGTPPHRQNLISVSLAGHSSLGFDFYQARWVIRSKLIIISTELARRGDLRLSKTSSFFFAQDNALLAASCALLGMMRSSMYHQLWSAAGGLSCRQANHCRLASTAGLASPVLVRHVESGDADRISKSEIHASLHPRSQPVFKAAVM